MLGLDGYNLRGDVQSLLNHSSGITAGYFSMSIASVVVSEVDLNRSQVLAVQQIGENDPPLVSDSNTYGVVRGRGQHNIPRHIGYMYRYLDFLLIGVVKRHEEPENTREQDEKQENQELLVQVAEQESPDLPINADGT